MFFHHSCFPFYDLKWGHLCSSVPSESCDTVKCFANAFFPSLSCLILNSTEFYSQCSCFIYRRVWISTRWSGCCVKWRSFWKARRCGLPRASGSWSQSWRHFRTLSPRCPRRTSQLASGLMLHFMITLKERPAKLLLDIRENRFGYVQNPWLHDFYSWKKEEVRSDVCCTIKLMSVNLLFLPSTGTAALVPLTNLTLLTKQWRMIQIIV